MLKRTSWYQPSIKPVREGWYETRLYRSDWPYSTFWTGSEWVWSNTSPCLSQNREWRGLSQNPKEQA